MTEEKTTQPIQPPPVQQQQQQTAPVTPKSENFPLVINDPIEAWQFEEFKKQRVEEAERDAAKIRNLEKTVASYLGVESYHLVDLGNTENEDPAKAQYRKMIIHVAEAHQSKQQPSAPTPKEVPSSVKQIPVEDTPQFKQQQQASNPEEKKPNPEEQMIRARQQSYWRQYKRKPE